MDPYYKKLTFFSLLVLFPALLYSLGLILLMANKSKSDLLLWDTSNNPGSQTGVAFLAVAISIWGAWLFLWHVIGIRAYNSWNKPPSAPSVATPAGANEPPAADASGAAASPQRDSEAEAARLANGQQ